MLIPPTRRMMTARPAPFILLRRYQFLPRVSRAAKESQDINYQSERIDTLRNESMNRFFSCALLCFILITTCLVKFTGPTQDDCCLCFRNRSLRPHPNRIRRLLGSACYTECTLRLSRHISEIGLRSQFSLIFAGTVILPRFVQYKRFYDASKHNGNRCNGSLPYPGKGVPGS